MMLKKYDTCIFFELYNDIYLFTYDYLRTVLVHFLRRHKLFILYEFNSRSQVDWSLIQFIC